MSRKLAVVGFGKMGQLVAQLAPEFGFEVAAKVDLGDSLEAAKGCDAAIEFTTPEAAAANLEGLAALRVPTVTGSTGWLDRMDRVRAAFDATGTPMVWSPNFSIGVNVFLRVVREAAKLLAAETDYEAWAWEIHHSAKLDRHSGTLLALTGQMKAAGYTRPIDVNTNRAGKHPGTHEIGFDSAADTIALRHTARNREGFARGALKAAQWIPGKTGVHEFADIFTEVQQS